ncbi:MAG: DUF3177 family protein [Pseudanabaenaceae cyanobacterium bins.68]|nr:DUF3177 family protein [Pseudanabaenaceae cyanobacterium bins.68]
MNELIRSWVWWDFRLATAFTVIAPLGLLVWAVIQKNKTLIKALTIYWRVSALLAITVYLLIADLSFGYITGWLARILIPASLWFWSDLNALISQARRRLDQVYRLWRWLVTGYCMVGTLTGLAFLPCSLNYAFSPGVCDILTEAPKQFQQIFHPSTPVEILARGAILALGLYVIYFICFLMFKLRRHGRSALITRDQATG